MRTMKSLVAGVLLTGLSLACLLSGRMIEVKAEKTATAQAQNRVAINATANPLHPAWRISSAISFNNLTVFPVVSDEPTSTDEFITLDEGLRSGKVIITELGTDGRSRRIRRNRVSDNADVNKLAVTNRSGKMLVLIAGELLVGGKQDRIVGNDCIVSSTNKPVPINVFCVEHGRWSEEASFGQSRSVASGTGDGPGSGGGVGSGVAPPMAAIAMPNLRAKAQADKSQSAVWNEVAKAQTENVVVTATGDLTSVYRDKRVKGKIDSYERALKNKLSAANVVGVVVAIGDRIISADVFANHSLFQAYWPKMLKSYALEALNSSATNKQEVSRSDAEGFLSRVQGESATDDKPGVYKLAENQSTKDASFELQSASRKATLVHFNRVSKQ
ncbi:MAG TPA: DUF6569 family protein [Blastocatellia bacterium]|nr:DUF6569 family protein [Blastocatellia bacterium]